MPWKPEYAAARKERYHADEAERDRRKSQGRRSEENKEYMQKYYVEKPEKFSNTQERRDRNNAARRAKYAADPEYAARMRAAASARSPISKRNGRLKSTYGITQVDYERMLADQGSSCAICAAKHEETRGKILHVDHCHTTGKVRQLLCTACNTALGKFRDDVERLRSAIAYLERHAIRPVADILRNE